MLIGYETPTHVKFVSFEIDRVFNENVIPIGVIFR